MAIPGLKVVAPSTPADVLGLMVASIRDPDPVIFCASKALLATKGDVPDGEHVVPLGKAAIVREGGDCTIVALASMVPRAVEAAERLSAEQGIEAEVIDLRTLVPLDVATILASVEKTSRLFTVEENPRLCGWGAEIVSLVADEGFYSLDAPLVRITTPHIPLAGGAGPRGRGAPDGRPDRRHDPSPARGREVTDGAAPTVGVVGTGRMGSAMAKALARAGRPLVLHNRSRDRAEALAAELGARVAVDPGRGRRGRGRHDHDARRRRRGGPGLRRRRRAPGRGASRLGARRPQHRHARGAPGVRARGPGGRGRAAGRAGERLDRAGGGRPADADGRRRRGRPRPGAARARGAGEDDLPPRTARDRRRDEAGRRTR